jgi:acyl-CoA thioester hydrolase
MPLTHTRTFRVRHYECDTYGHVNAPNYLRYMQEAALDASAAVGYDEARYNELGSMWLIRETDIEYLSALRYGDSVEVTTWVEDFRRVRSRRRYDLVKVGTGEKVAQAATDWVYIDRTSGQPMHIPQVMIDAFMEQGIPASAAPREKFPDAPPAPPGVYSLQRRVEWRDIDAAGHVNNAVYMNYLEDAGIQAARACGWPVGRMMNIGIAIMARRYQIEYRQPAALDDDLVITTYLSNARRSTILRHYKIMRPSDDALILQARTQWMAVNPTTQTLTRFPAEFIANFASNIAGDP